MSGNRPELRASLDWQVMGMLAMEEGAQGFLVLQVMGMPVMEKGNMPALGMPSTKEKGTACMVWHPRA